MTFFRDYAKSINESIAKTAFGRVFRLQGCGHVSCAHIAEGRDFLLTRNAGEGDQEHSLSHRDPCRPYNLCYHGIHYRCECELRAGETALECEYLTGLQRPRSYLKLAAHAFVTARPILPVQKTPIMLNVFLVISCCALRMRFLTGTGIQRDLITATAAISGLASFMFGLLTNLPVALA